MSHEFLHEINSENRADPLWRSRRRRCLRALVGFMFGGWVTGGMAKELAAADFVLCLR
jgi:hypothetical protein